MTLRRPVPLERELDLQRGDDRAVVLLDGDDVLAEARADDLDLDVPPPVTLAEAEDASTRFPYLEGHAFPTCFGCGPERQPGDGLRIFAGPVSGRDDVYAAPWTPDPSLADGCSVVHSEFVWAALDCSGGCRVANARSTPPVVLGRLTARVARPVIASEPYVILAWPGPSDGRKREAGTAVHTANGEIVALARALWIELR